MRNPVEFSVCCEYLTSTRYSLSLSDSNVNLNEKVGTQPEAALQGDPKGTCAPPLIESLAPSLIPQKVEGLRLAT